MRIGVRETPGEWMREGMILTEVGDGPDASISTVPKPGKEINDEVDVGRFQGCRVPRVR
jgi:hypothetical protein